MAQAPGTPLSGSDYRDNPGDSPACHVRSIDKGALGIPEAGQGAGWDGMGSLARCIWDKKRMGEGLRGKGGSHDEKGGHGEEKGRARGEKGERGEKGRGRGEEGGGQGEKGEKGKGLVHTLGAGEAGEGDRQEETQGLYSSHCVPPFRKRMAFCM